MIGGVIGDTIGSVYEFGNTKNYNFQLFTSRSVFTDDSLMSFSVAKWLIADRNHSYEELEHFMVEMAMKYPHPMGGYGGAFNLWLFNSPNGRRPYRSWGNGSAMRVIPIGWFFESLDETEHVARISAEITHNHPEGIKGAKAVAASIWLARNGKSKDEIKKYIESKYGYNLNHTWKELNVNYKRDSSCQGSVPEAISCFLESSDFEDSIRKAVSIGGDSDTLACINGGIAEAFYQSIPVDILKETIKKLPVQFKDILHYMSNNTFYKDCWKKMNCDQILVP